MPSSEDIAAQQQLLAIHRRNLTLYLEQQAAAGPLGVSPSMINGIADARQHIRRIKLQLRAWGVVVDDHPDDEAPVKASSARASTPHQTASRKSFWLWGLIILVLAVVIFGRDTILARLPQRLSELATGTATTAHQTTGGTSDIPVVSEIPTTSQANSLSTKSAIMTDRDGNATVVPADTLRRCSSVNTTLYLDNGQSVLLGNVKRIDVTRSSSSNTLFAITLLDNTRIEGLASRCSFLGETSIGSFELWDEKLQSIVIESGNTQPSLQPSPTTTYKPLWQSRAVMTDRNGNGTEVPADTLRRCSGVNTTLNLDNGQSVSLDKVKRIDVVRSSSTNTLFAITLLDEIRLEGLVGRCSFLGETSAGRFELWDENLQRVEIFRE